MFVFNPFTENFQNAEIARLPFIYHIKYILLTFHLSYSKCIVIQTDLLTRYMINKPSLELRCFSPTVLYLFNESGQNMAVHAVDSFMKLLKPVQHAVRRQQLPTFSSCQHTVGRQQLPPLSCCQHAVGRQQLPPLSCCQHAVGRQQLPPLCCCQHAVGRQKLPPLSCFYHAVWRQQLPYFYSCQVRR